MNIIEDTIEVDILHNENFLKIKETLERIGTTKNDVMYAECNILHSQGRYFIMSYKVGKMINGSKNEVFEENDISKCFTISKLLEQWNLLKIINCPEKFKRFSLDGVAIVPYKERNKWKFVNKFTLGR